MNFTEFLQMMSPKRTITITPQTKAAVNPVVPPVKQELPIQIKNRGLTITPKELKLLKAIIFSEISNRSPEKRELETRIVINTALNRMKEQNKTLTQVLTQKNAYQGIGIPEFAKAMRGNLNMLDKQKMAVIDKVTSELSSGNFNDTTSGSVFYHHQPDGTIWYRPGKLGGWRNEYHDISALTQTP